ncbi:trigger factor [Pirellulaceae bacterium SH449]
MSAVETQDDSKLLLNVKIDQPSSCVRHVVVTIPRSEIERYFRKVYDEIAPRADLPGFRAGKIPRKLLENRFRQTATEQVKSSLVMDSLQQVTEGGEFSAISEPDMDYGAVDIPATGDFTYEFKIEVRPEFETPNWKGLELKKTEFKVTDEEVDLQLHRTLERITQGEAVDDTAKPGDRVVVSIDFKHEGKVVSSVDEVVVTLRSKLSLADCIIENFGELLTGAKEGEKLSTKVKIFETSLNEAFRGVEVDAEISVEEVRRVNVEGMSKSVLDTLGFDTTEELKDFVRAELVRQCEYHQNQLIRTQVSSLLTAGADWELPQALVRRQADREMHRRVLELRRSGFTDDQIRSVVNNLRRNIEETTKVALREHFVLEKIAEDLTIEPTEAEYDSEIELIAQQSDLSARQVRAKLERNGQMDALRNQILERRVIDTIVAEAKVTPEDGGSILKEEADEFALEHLVAPVSQILPEARYDEQPEDGSENKSVKPT